MKVHINYQSWVFDTRCHQFYYSYSHFLSLSNKTILFVHDLCIFFADQTIFSKPSQRLFIRFCTRSSKLCIPLIHAAIKRYTSKNTSKTMNQYDNIQTSMFYSRSRSVHIAFYVVSDSLGYPITNLITIILIHHIYFAHYIPFLSNGFFCMRTHRKFGIWIFLFAQKSL